MDINSVQNTPHAQSLLAAQRYTYSRAKKARSARVVLSVAVALLFPFLIFCWPVAKGPLAALAFFWTIASKFVVENFEREWSKRAAAIQEQFDTLVFDLPAAKGLGVASVAPELIAEAGREFTGNRHALRDWYPDVTGLPREVAILLCQRANVTWDFRLRRNYAWAVGALTAAVLVLPIGYALYATASIEDYVLTALAPTSSIIVLGIDVFRSHMKSASENESLAKDLVTMFDRALSGALTIDECRETQNRIYLARERNPPLPDWWYERLRMNYQNDLDEASTILREKALKKLK